MFFALKLISCPVSFVTFTEKCRILSIFSTEREHRRKLYIFFIKTKWRKKNNEATRTKPSEFWCWRKRINSMHKANKINRIPVKHRKSEMNDTERNKIVNRVRAYSHTHWRTNYLLHEQRTTLSVRLCIVIIYSITAPTHKIR